MFVRCKKRFKDGKEHRYWSVVENVRVSGGRVVQRQVLYLGEINDSQRAAWCRSIEVVEGASRSKQVALFPEDREAPELECEVVQVRLAELTLHAPRQWGACWLALTLWERLELDRFWGLRLPASREGTRWLDILKIQVCYRLIDPGSDWRLHRQWYEHSALRDLVRQANWQKVGGASPPKRRSNQATFLREPCVGPREGAGEASVAVRMGRAIEHRKRNDPGCRGFQIGRRQHRRHRFGEMSADPAVSENPCTFACLVSGPWEVFRLPHML